MDKDKTLGVWFFAIQIGLAILLYWMEANRAKQKTIIAANAAEKEPDFAGTWNYTAPAAGFQSTINVYADNPLAAGLAYQYMPIFGLVGFNSAGFPGA